MEQSAARTFDILGTVARRLVFWLRLALVGMLILGAVAVVVIYQGERNTRAAVLQGQRENRELLLAVISGKCPELIKSP